MVTGYFNLHPARRALASIDRDCINLLGSKQVVSRARNLRGARVEKNMRTPGNHLRIRAQLRFGPPVATYLFDILSGVSQNEVSFRHKKLRTN